tara:strand:+ start:331 stop:642 length:312 start_codon:yes stop_codon:yes gene_type:complete
LIKNNFLSANSLKWIIEENIINIDDIKKRMFHLSLINLSKSIKKLTMRLKKRKIADIKNADGSQKIPILNKKFPISLIDIFFNSSPKLINFIFMYFEFKNIFL